MQVAVWKVFLKVEWKEKNSVVKMEYLTVNQEAVVMVGPKVHQTVDC
jgi:hypothetical protein